MTDSAAQGWGFTPIPIAGGGFACPVCFKQTHVSDSRSTEEGFVRRRRRCECGFRFTTIEVPLGVEHPSVERHTKELRASLEAAQLQLHLLEQAIRTLI